ncbi:EscU/YscU/HrcU family type III secretion system export apparatus switch protein [Alkalimarinus sediminis]|uniref:Flagellar biosynthetic protein FlhB n=1 Tax=Alkalimarinus sediminis TaxID=1632866 RepID=A0A9E8HLK9_9ALTE|nr:EscU/YscU/HrcU family type III secretion system export apparatus switch protein [Alkalimarinus sediminis]UZW76719.1 EscU/YscU/HrcU family type III secretion system export apparatus switch protein [Alkalimarinus sediminis]
MNKHEELTTAVALKYDGKDAPTITATGEGSVAEEIIRIAKEANIPLYENADLVALLSQLELGENIPEVLYKVIAEIIAFAYHIQNKVPEGFNRETGEMERREKPIN